MIGIDAYHSLTYSTLLLLYFYSTLPYFYSTLPYYHKLFFIRCSL